ncbi:response regulator [Dyella humi]|uniref:Response regulator n=1 Tax=Dyella humi TaxID=1770547 RepID=A0ABW8IQ83_9GAMM
MTTVLYVEDDDDNAFMLTRRLERHGIHMRHVESGEKALIDAVWKIPDVVLLDISLPGMDGLSVLQKLRSNPLTQSVPVIVLSAHVMEDDITRALEAGADAFVPKPIEFPRLLEALDRVIKHDSHGGDSS